MGLTKGNFFFLLANAIGIFIFAMVDIGSLSVGKGDEGGTDPIGAFCFALIFGIPLVVIFLGLSLVWLVVLLRNKSGQSRPPLIALILSGISWLIAIACTYSGWAIMLYASIVLEKVFGMSSLK